MRGGPARQPRGQRGTDVEVEVSLSFEDSLKGVETTLPGEPRELLPRLRRLGREAGYGAGRLPAVRRPRRRRRVAGPVRALVAVPALPRQRDDHRGAVLELPRLRPRAANTPVQGQDPGRREGRHAHQAARQGRGRLRRRPGRRPLRRHPRRAVEALPPPRRGGPRDRRAGHVRRGGARRDRRGADAGRACVAEGPVGHRGRQAAPHQGPRRAEAEGLGPRRPDRARPRDRSEEAVEGGEGGDREAAGSLARGPEGEGVHDDRRPAALHDQRRRRDRRHAPADAPHLRVEGARAAGPHARRHAALLGARPRAAARDPAADDGARAQPRRRRSACSCSRTRWRSSARAMERLERRCARRSSACTSSTGAISSLDRQEDAAGCRGRADRWTSTDSHSRARRRSQPRRSWRGVAATRRSRRTTCCWRCSTRSCRGRCSASASKRCNARRRSTSSGCP